MTAHLGDYALAYVASAMSMFSLVTHQPDSVRLFAVMAVLAVVVADLAKIRASLGRLRVEKDDA